MAALEAAMEGEEEGLPIRGPSEGMLGAESSEDGEPTEEPELLARSPPRPRRRWPAAVAGAAFVALALLSLARVRSERGGRGTPSGKAEHIVELAGYVVKPQGAAKVTLSMPIKGVNYEELMKDTSELLCLSNAVRDAVASVAKQGVEESDVQVAFASGSSGVMAQVDVVPGGLLGPQTLQQVRKGLKLGAGRLGHRLSIFVGLKRCKPPMKGTPWPVGEAASVPADSIKCSTIVCLSGKVAEGYNSKSCSGASCVSECCEKESEVHKPPPPPEAEKSPSPLTAEEQKAVQEAEKTPKPVWQKVTQALCNGHKGRYFDENVSKCLPCRGGETRRRSGASKCSPCEEGTFQPVPGGMDDCMSCKLYVRRRRADKCTACAETTSQNLKPDANCSYLALATDGIDFSFGLQFKYWTPHVSKLLLQAPGFSLVIAGKDHGANDGKVFFSFEPLNPDAELPAGGFFIYSRRTVEGDIPYNVTVTKNVTHLCLTIVPSKEEQKEEDHPHHGEEADTANCKSYEKYAFEGLFQMKPTGDLSWGSVQFVDRWNYHQLQGNVVMSFDIAGVMYGKEHLEAFESCVRKVVALYAGPGFVLADVKTSALAETHKLPPPSGHLPEGLFQERYAAEVEATLRGWGASAELLDEITNDVSSLETAVKRWLTDEMPGLEEMLAVGRRLRGEARNLEGPGEEITVKAAVGVEAERSCAGRLCPVGTKLMPNRRCAGASCLETCCAPTTCSDYAAQCSPLLPRPPLPVVTCKGKEDCDDKCCVGKCSNFDCKASNVEGPAHCPKENSSELLYIASQAVETCCNKALCCAQTRPACDACRQCQSLESYCENWAKKQHISEDELRQVGCLEEKVPDCDYKVQASFFLHQGTGLTPQMATAVDVLPDATHAVSGGEDGVGWIWKLGTGEPVMALPGNEGPIYAAVALIEPEYVTLGGEDGKVRTYYWRTGHLEKETEVEGGGPLLSIADFQAWRLMGLAYSDNFVRIYNFHNGAKLRLPYGPKNAKDYQDGIKEYFEEQHKYYFEKSDPLIRVASEKAFEEALEEMPPVNPSKVPPNPTLTWGPVTRIVYFPVSFNFATGHNDGKIRFWSATNGKLIREMGGHKGPVTALSALPTSLEMFSGGADGMIMKWDGRTGKHLLTINAGSAGAVTDLTVAGFLYSSHTDGTVRRWKVAGGQAVCKWQTHGGRINSIAHNPGARSMIVTASQDGIARTWVPSR